jgi:HTH-type transcriptional regulator/antitoxin HigA
MKTKRKAVEFRKLPTRYAELVTAFPLRPIHDKVDADNATEIIDAMAGHDLTEDQSDYLDVLSDLLDRYESEREAADHAEYTPVQRLKYLMEQSEMTTADLGRLLGNRGLASLILNGHRQLSKTHMVALGKHFSVDPGLFL